MDARYDLGTISRPCAEYERRRGLVEVLGEFHRQKVSYCYWKSSRRLDAAFAGEGDIDLLVQSQDQHRVQAILLELDFKLFPSVTDRDHPGMLSFLGYDERSGQLIHIHLHFRLLLGESLLKNYRMPWEEVLLARAVLHPTLPIRILDPASEALLLVVRACIELRRLDLPTLRNWHATTRKFALDRAELATRVQRSMLRDLASELLSEHLAEIVTEAFYCERPLERQAGLRRLIGNHCAAYRNYNSVEARVRSAGRALLWAVGNLNPQNEILGFNDGPLLTRLTVVPHWLRRFEAAVYALARRLPPDLVIKLVVAPETVARREPEMEEVIIRHRVAALQRLEFPGARVVCVDAERPLAEVMRTIKREIWRLI